MYVYITSKVQLVIGAFNMDKKFDRYTVVLDQLQMRRKGLVEKREAIYLERFLNTCYLNVAIGVNQRLQQTNDNNLKKYTSELEFLNYDLSFINSNLKNESTHISLLIKKIDDAITEIKTLTNC